MKLVFKYQMPRKLGTMTKLLRGSWNPTAHRCPRCSHAHKLYYLEFIFWFWAPFFAPRPLLLLDGAWTTKSPADGNKSLSLPKSICSQEVVSSCPGKDLSAWRRSTISCTDYSGRDHITVKYCFWITRLVKKHSYSVSELPDGLFCSRSQRTTTR